MKKNSILVISNNPETGEYIANKVNLLRESDKVETASFIEAVSILHSEPPSLILVYCEQGSSVEIVKAVRSIKSLDRVPVIFVTDTYDEELLLSAFDNGIDDFFFLDSPDTLILMRIFLTLQKAVLYQKADFDSEISVSIGLTDKATGIYSREKSNFVMNSLFDKVEDEGDANTVFVMLKLMPLKNDTSDIVSPVITVKKILRGSDITVYGYDDNLYVVLNNCSNSNCVQSLYSRLKAKLSDKFEIYAVATPVKYSFDKTEEILSEELVNLIINQGCIKYILPEEIAEKLKLYDTNDISGEDSETKSPVISGKLENVILGAFESAKKYASDLSKSIKVTSSVSETESTFGIKKGTLKTDIIISRCNLTKLVILINDSESDKILSSKKKIYQADNITEEKLTSVLTEIISKYK